MKHRYKRRKRPYVSAILLGLSVLLTVLSIVLAPKPKFENARPANLGDFEVPTATEDRAVPVLWGQADIIGPNVIWHGDLRAKEIRDKVSKGLFSGSEKIVVGHRYFLGMDMLLCYGPLDRVTRLETADKIVFGPNSTIIPASDSGTPITINDKNFHGGRKKGGGIGGTMRIYGGTPNQGQNAYMISVIGTPDVPGYLDIAHVMFEQWEFGESTRIDPYIFRCTRFPDNLSLTNGPIVNGNVLNGDANPAEVIYEILTNTTWGLGLDPTRVNTPSFKTAGETLFAEGQGFSLIVTSQKRASEIIKEVLRQISGNLFEDVQGQWVMSLNRFDYFLPDQPLFDETNIIEIERFTRGSWTETINHIGVTYRDREKDYQVTQASAIDLANAETQGRVVRADMKFPGVTTASLANAIAARELAFQSFPVALLTFRTQRVASSIVPGDVIRFSWAKYNVVDMPIRVLKLRMGDSEGGDITVEGAQDIFRIADTQFTEPQKTRHIANQVAALDLVDVLIQPAPRIAINTSPALVNQTSDRVMTFAARPVASPATTAYTLRVDPVFPVTSTPHTGASELEFRDEGDSNGMTPLAMITSDYSRFTADIDTAGLVVTEVDGLSRIQGLTAAEVLNGLSLAMIEGSSPQTSEIIGWEGFTDLGGGQFRLENVHRGLMDTQHRGHTAGANVWFFSYGNAVSKSTFAVAADVGVRLQSRTAFDQLPLDGDDPSPPFPLIAPSSPRTITTYNLVFNDRVDRLHHPANAQLNGIRLPLLGYESGDPASVTWDHRLNSDIDIRDADIASSNGDILQVQSAEYYIRLRNRTTGVVYNFPAAHIGQGGQLRDQSMGAGWTSLDWSNATAQTDASPEVGRIPLRVDLRITTDSSPTSGVGYQQLVYDCSYDIGGATDQSISLNGTNEYLQSGGDTLRLSSGNFTWDGWVRPTTNAGGTQRWIFHSKPAASNSARIELSVTDDSNGSAWNVKIYNTAGTLIKDYDFGSAYTLNTWTHLAFTYDSTSFALRVYEDGAEDTTPTKNTDANLAWTDNSILVTMGIDPGLTTGHWQGNIHSISMWDLVLPPAAITEIEAQGTGFNKRFRSLPNYTDAHALGCLHTWDFRNSTNIGEDYVGTISAVGRLDMLVNAVNITSADLDAVNVP